MLSIDEKTFSVAVKLESVSVTKDILQMLFLISEKLAFNRSVDQSVNQLINQSINSLISQSINRSVSHTVIQWICGPMINTNNSINLVDYQSVMPFVYSKIFLSFK